MEDVYGQTIDLNAYRDRKVYMSFFRNVNCPFCNLRIHELIRKKEELNHLQLIFFLESSLQQIQRSIFHQEVSPIPLIADPQHEVYSKYRVESSMMKMMNTFMKAGTMSAMKQGRQFDVPDNEEKHVSMTLMPADFLIGPGLVIEKVNYGSHLRDHLPLDELTAFNRS